MTNKPKRHRLIVELTDPRGEKSTKKIIDIVEAILDGHQNDYSLDKIEVKNYDRVDAGNRAKQTVFRTG